MLQVFIRDLFEHSHEQWVSDILGYLIHLEEFKLLLQKDLLLAGSIQF